MIVAPSLFVSQTFVSCMPANPCGPGFQITQPDGTITPELFVRGDHISNYIVDKNGYNVMIDEDGWYVYGTGLESSDEKQRELFVSDSLFAGKESPDKVPGLIESKAPTRDEALTKYSQNRCGEKNKKCQSELMKLEKEKQNRRASGSALVKKKISVRQNNLDSKRNMLLHKGEIKNLVVPIRFSDDKYKNLPTRTELDILFNSAGGHETIAPTGSVRDVFYNNSYGELWFKSEVVDWITLPRSEEYYADKKSGLTDKLIEALHEALDILEGQGFDFTPFDEDENGEFDALTFAHSGYMAEWGGQDCEKQKPPSERIWSHHWSMPKRFHWVSADRSIKMRSYLIGSALWDICGAEVAHIGMMAHELGHELGLKDLYDTAAGSGLGFHDLMASAWGADGMQLYPPLMSAWTKMQLGLVEVIELSSSGFYELSESISSNIVYRVDAGFPDQEYLLIENRQPVSFDSKLPQGGLAIYHIDDTAPLQQERGFPGQKGWPENGKHYQVALLQADGRYHLERGTNKGNKGDLWSLGFGSELGPGNDKFPNTDSYQFGKIKKTGLRIDEISESGPTMRFRISGNLLNSLSPTRSIFPAFPTGTPLTLPSEVNVNGLMNLSPSPVTPEYWQSAPSNSPIIMRQPIFHPEAIPSSSPLVTNTPTRQHLSKTFPSEKIPLSFRSAHIPSEEPTIIRYTVTLKDHGRNNSGSSLFQRDSEILQTITIFSFFIQIIFVIV